MKRLFFSSFAVLMFAVSANAQTLSDNLFGYWPIDATSGDVVENRGGDGIPGTNFGADWVMDEGHSALSFFRDDDDYVDTNIDIPALTAEGHDFTWSFWGKNGAGNGGNDVILGNRNGRAGGFSPRQFIKFTPTKFEYDRQDAGIEDVNYSDGVLEADGPWIHHLVVKQGPDLTYYRNGQFDNAITLDTLHERADFVDPQPFFFGGDQLNENWTGLIDDVALWDRALNEGDVVNIAAAGTDGLKSLLGATGPIIPPVAGRNTIGVADVPSSVVDGSLVFGEATTGPGLAQEWYSVGNPGDKAGVDAIFAANQPVVPAFRSAEGSWWTGNGALPGLPNYPPEVQPQLTDQYTVRSTGEILIEQSGVITFTDGVDDFTYLAIDLDQSGTAGDTADEVLINDNAWTTVLRDGNGGGGGYAEPNFENIADGGEWFALEFNMGEGGGGDSGTIYWDYDVNAPFDLRNQGLLLPFVDQAFFSAEEAAAAVIPDSHLRSTTAPLVSGDVSGDVPGSPAGWEIDVNAADGSSDMFVLNNPDDAVFATEMNVDGIEFHINVTDGDPTDGQSFQVIVADTISGTPSIATEGWTFDAGTGSVVFGGGMVMIPGDADGDGDVDTADRTIQTTNWTGALPPGDPGATKTKGEGDADGDGDVDTADANLAITNWTGAQQGAGNLTDGDDANLVYDPASGNVTLDAGDTASGVFISFVMATGQNNMVPDNLAKSADGSAGPFFDVGTNTDATTFQIGQTDPLNQGAGPEIDLGDIFPAGMDLAGLSEYLTLADYASALGEGGTLDLIVVPEPSSIALLLLGVMGLVARRRRK